MATLLWLPWLLVMCVMTSCVQAHEFQSVSPGYFAIRNNRTLQCLGIRSFKDQTPVMQHCHMTRAQVWENKGFLILNKMIRGALYLDVEDYQLRKEKDRSYDQRYSIGQIKLGQPPRIVNEEQLHFFWLVRDKHLINRYNPQAFVSMTPYQSPEGYKLHESGGPYRPPQPIATYPWVINGIVGGQDTIPVRWNPFVEWEIIPVDVTKN